MSDIKEEKIAGMKRKSICLKNAAIILVGCKLGILIRLYNHWVTGGFNIEELQEATVSLFVIAAVPFIRLVLKYLKTNYKKTDLESNYLPNKYYYFVVFVIIAYGLLTLALLELKVMAAISFTRMIILIMLVESALNFFIGEWGRELLEEGDKS